jgi:hypothetical protein
VQGTTIDTPQAADKTTKLANQPGSPNSHTTAAPAETL